MKQTENYQLNQWELTDRIQMEDFNGDNQKIDAALAGKLGAIEVIQESAVGSGHDSVAVDLSGINWNEWSVVAVALWFNPGYSASSDTTTMFISLDNCPTYGQEDQLPGKRSLGPMMAVFFPWRDASRQIHFLVFPTGDMALSDKTYAELDTMYFSRSGTGNSLPSEGKVILFGVR